MTKKRKLHYGRGMTLEKSKALVMGAVGSWQGLQPRELDLKRMVNVFLDTPDGQKICKRVVQDNAPYRIDSGVIEGDGRSHARVYMLDTSHDNKFFTLIIYGTDSKGVYPTWLMKFESLIKLKDYNTNYNWTKNEEWVEDDEMEPEQVN